MKWLFLLALALPGGFVIMAGGSFGFLWAAAATGVPGLDRAAIRGNAVVNLLRVFGWNATPALVKVYMGILREEGAYEAGPDGTYPLGDLDDDSGPAIGPGQVLRVNLERLGVADPIALANVGNEREALYRSVQILKEAYDEERGDLRETARRYNGSGPRAEAYADRVMAHAGVSV